MAAVMMISLLVLLLLSVPVALSIGLASTVAFMNDGSMPLIVLIQRMFAALDSFPLMAIPFFILAGSLMESGGISRRLVNFANSLAGGMTGGLAVVTVVTAMFFSAISGSSAATTAAIGSILIPAMVKKGYDIRFAGATQAVSGELGVIIPPSIPMILFGISAGVSIGDLFIAGFLPGIMIGGSLILVCWYISKRRGYKGETGITWSHRWQAFKEALLALLMPVIILGGIYGGFFTPTEAAVIAVLYALIVGVFVYREVKWKQLVEIFSKSAITTSIIMIIISAAGMFGWILTREQVPQKIAAAFTAFSDNPIIFLALINLLLIFVGMFFETSASIIILAPLLTPIAVQLGIDPVHFGMIMIVNLAMGMVTPPVGVNLFVACQIAGIKLEELTKALIPFFIMLIVDILIITYVPAISTWLPSLLK
ncbi:MULTISPECIES: TRAP transporter large permease [Brevibacillus]|jgi:C4-dicarboxylate transporter DctM subunit|uniref:TRAP dicarboxylate transporter subunit DctM n=1 Tax=Brevibacillus borstelensis AK1 TaxID=1300222 RepID=M8DMG4_9BACL|nr:TRAP transporter large permease [Brevibacillus borstelensis]EMT54647.1 TRAP dicarboxylate transporter subunit DctM [Brevibacillus borstelensis AK1]MBE5396521.1 TRAP transporter large permease [Brevibacillus borstelensis]MCC0566409.1 TRAP transporter large permease [Brevibacillus borstelensis]MCM3471767.1 TRAP transporter large permease [Brevibacillus borstelensis]MCM3557559.1 TRAP transporter large permease [Brevibacillus borstelensis]